MRRSVEQPFTTMRDGREVCSQTVRGKREYRIRTLAMAKRQGWLCALCGSPMTESSVSFDHELGRGMGGSRRQDKIEVDGKRHNAAVHVLCNGVKGSRRVPYILQ
jgi:hypothetical protein